MQIVAFFRTGILVITVFINFLARLLCHIRATDIFTRSGSFAFTILLSFVPFTISMVSIISWLPISSHAIAKIQHHVFTDYLPPDAGEQIYRQVKIFLHQSRNLSILGFGSLLITTYLMIFEIEKQLNAIWYNKLPRKLGHSLFKYTLFLICGIALSSMVSILQISRLVIFNSGIAAIINQVISILITILLFVMVYKVIPSHKTSFKHAFIAATLATASFLLIKVLFTYVLVKIFVDYSVIYGSLSFIPIFLLWIYLSCLNVFFCAGVIYTLETKFDRELQHKINRVLRLLFLTQIRKRPKIQVERRL